MIESIEDLELNTIMEDLEKSKIYEISEFERRLSEVLQSKLDISLLVMKSSLERSLQDRVNLLIKDIRYIAPFNDYSALMDEEDKMINFLKSEAFKAENWRILTIDEDVKENLIKFTFSNKAVNEADILFGTVFVNKSGKIKHSFTYIEE